jgi:hypothetical protein
MAIKVEVLSNTPTLFETDSSFMALGKLKANGDTFIVFMSLISGKIYVEEAFATMVNGQCMTGFSLVEDDKLWAVLIQEAQRYKIIHASHIANCLDKMNVRISNNVAKLLAPNKKDYKYFKDKGVIR